MERVYNFSAGPAVLPLEVLERAQKEFVYYKDFGMSVTEMSHRSKMYMDIIENAETLLRKLMGIPENYKVMFMQGGASAQFSMVPLNLFKTKKADYVITGEFAKKAMQEAKRYGEINVVASSEDATFNYIPKLDSAKFNKNADYFHYTTNNTIFGTKFTQIPETGNVPLVTDMSSNILSEVYDVSKFGYIYAGAQKNIGPAGLTVGIIREDLVGDAMDITPTLFKFKTYVENDSMYNTPPTYAIYFAMIVFEWLLNMGGIPAIQKINEEKSKMLYDYLDESKLFEGTAVKEYRSMMNVTYVTGSKELDEKYVKDAEKAGLLNIKGHRSVGGMRASIYNAMPIEGIKALVEFSKKFEMDNR